LKLGFFEDSQNCAKLAGISFHLVAFHCKLEC
jgi:hypothetical protein